MTKKQLKNSFWAWLYPILFILDNFLIFEAWVNVIHSWEDIIYFHLFSIFILFYTNITIAIFFYIIQEFSSILALLEHALHIISNLLLL